MHTLTPKLHQLFKDLLDVIKDEDELRIIDQWVSNNFPTPLRPSWDDAPEWANWLAQDATGIWMWYENDPSPYGKVPHWDSQCGKCDNAFVYKDWEETLEQRPVSHKLPPKPEINQLWRSNSSVIKTLGAVKVIAISTDEIVVFSDKTNGFFTYGMNYFLENFTNTGVND